MKKLSVILPCYNEKQNIRRTIEEVKKFSKLNPDYNFIFVDDGSKDETKKILEEEIKKAGNKSIKLISYAENKGKGNAVKMGVMNAEGDCICFTDSDLAYSLEHLKLLKEKLETCDIAIGVRGLAKQGVENVPLSRKIIGNTFNLFSRILLGLKFKDMQAGLKGFRKEAAKRLFEKQKIEGWAFDTEILYLAKKHGYKIKEVPAFVSNNDSYKTSKIKVIRDSTKMLLAIMGIKLNDILGRYD